MQLQLKSAKRKTTKLQIAAQFFFFICSLFVFSSNATAECACTGNIVQNPSFENGTNSWHWSGGHFSTGNGAVVCGVKSGDFQITNTSSNWVSQTIGTNLAPGTKVNVSVYAGTHNNSFYHQVAIDFFDGNWNYLSSSKVEVNKVFSAAPLGPQLYTFSGTVPVGAVYTNISFGGTGDWIKTDQWCVTLKAPLSLGDRVFFDLNDNGTRDATEVGLSAVTVKLYADNNNDNVVDGAALQTTTTDGNGFYRFTNLAAGNYIVGVVVPNGYRSSTLSGVDPDNNVDLDDNGNNTLFSGEIRGNAITLASGTETQESGNFNHTYDFGFTGKASIGDFVWNDLNANGIQDPTEPGLAGVTVTLTYPGGTTRTTTSGANGAYQFNNLPPGSYSISFATPAGYVASASNQGTDDAKDSDPVNGTVTGITLTAGQNNKTIDAGYYQPASIGNFVWNDLNANGVQDAGEPGIRSVTVTLSGTDTRGNSVTASVVTDNAGAYNFSGLLPGTYSVTFATPDGYQSTTSNTGSDDAKDSDPVNGVVSSINLISGQNIDTIDAGFIQPIVLTGNVFYDDNGMGDGFVNGTTLIPSGINAVLYNPTTNVVLAVQPVPGFGQPGAGTFSFSIQPNSTYRVLITNTNPSVGAQAPATSTLPPSFRSTGETIGLAAGNDGTVDGKSSIITSANQNITEVNFALKRVVLVVVD